MNAPKLSQITVRLLLALTLFLGACANPKEDIVNPYPLKGHWTTDCTLVGSFYMIYEYDYGDAGSYQAEHRYASDDDLCATVLLTKAYNGTYFLSGNFGIDPNDDTLTFYELDDTYDTATWTVYDQTLLDTYNTNGTCGATDWELSVAKDVSAAACVTSKMATVYQIFHASNTLLYWGNLTATKDGTSTANRPVALNLDLTYWKN